MDWDLHNIRKIAGLPPLTESWDDDDDDSGEDADLARAERELKKQKIKLPKVKVDPEKDLHDLTSHRKHHIEKDDEVEDDEKPEPKKEAPKPEPKKEEPKKEESKPEPKKEESKKEEPSKEEKVDKRKLPRVKEDGKTHALRLWMQNHPGAKRSEAWAYAKSLENPFTPAGFSTIYQKLKGKKVAEQCYVIVHPHVSNFLLHENGSMGMYQWVSVDDDNRDPIIFESKEDADALVEYLENFKNQYALVERVVLED